MSRSTVSVTSQEAMTEAPVPLEVISIFTSSVPVTVVGATRWEATLVPVPKATVRVRKVCSAPKKSLSFIVAVNVTSLPEPEPGLRKLKSRANDVPGSTMRCRAEKPHPAAGTAAAEATP